jgi:hypothetical protein
MAKLNNQVIRALDVGGTTSNGLFSSLIEVIQSGWNWKNWGNKKIPAHVLFAYPIANLFFAAEAVAPEMQLDTSIEEEYLNKKGQTFLGFKRFPIFDDPAIQQKALNELARLKDVGLHYGWDEIIKQIGIHEKFSLWFIHIKADPKRICSGLVNYIVKFVGGKGWGTDPDPADIWADPTGVEVKDAVI